MTSLPDTRLLDVECSDGWLRIFLHDPDTRNALSESLSAELKSVLHAVRSDHTVRGISLRGRGGVFCAGGDLRAFSAMKDMSAGNARDAALASSLDGAELFGLIHTAPQVVVALIEGAAMAGGLGMACAADYVYATEDARFAFTETRLGLTPAQIAPYVINRVGPRIGRQLLLTGARFDGGAALEYGLVDELASDGAGLENLEVTLIEQVMQCAPEAIATTKRVIDDVIGYNAVDFRRRAAECFADCVTGKEGQEGMAAFFGKRNAVWAKLKDRD